MTESAHPATEHVSLQLDNGAVLDFRGRVFSEASWFDEESDTLTRQKLFITEDNEQVYSVVNASGPSRSRRAYRIGVQGDMCSIHNGKAGLDLPFDMLMLAVRALCGLDEDAVPSLEAVEETLRAANS